MNYRSKYTGAEIESALDKIINNVTDNDELATIIGNVNKRFDNYLPLTGGTISGKLVITGTLDANHGITVSNSRLLMKSYIRFDQYNENKEYLLGMTTAGSSLMWYDGSKWNSILNSGNFENLIGNTYLKTDGSNAMTNGLQLYTLGSGSVNVPLTDGVFIYRGPSTGGVDVGLPDSYTNVLNIGGSAAYSNLQLAWFRSMDELKLYARVGEAKGYGAWKEIIHEENYSDYALPLIGGKTITGSFTLADGVNIVNSTKYGFIVFDGTNNMFGAVNSPMVLRTNDSTIVHQRGSSNYYILDSSNFENLIGNTYLKTTGGVLTLEAIDSFVIRKTVNYVSLMRFDGLVDEDITPLGYFGFYGVNNPVFYDTTKNSFTLLHAGNYSNFTLPLTGGTVTGVLTIKNSLNAPLVLNSTASTTRIDFSNNNTRWGYLGFSALNTPAFINSGGGVYTLIHKGNVGEYALKVDGSNKIQSGKNIDWEGLNNNVEDYDSFSYGLRLLTYNTNTNNYRGGIHVGTRYGFQLTRLAYNEDNYLTIRFNNQSNNNTWGDWKTIAFTDSTVDKAKILVTDAGQRFAEFTESTIYIGRETVSVANTVIMGNAVNLRYGGGTNGLILNSSGNVTIGAEDLAGSDHKLYIIGGLRVRGATSVATLGEKIESASIFGAEHYGLQIWTYTSGNSNMQSGRFDGTATAYALNLNPLGGAVNVGEGGLNVASVLSISDKIALSKNRISTKVAYTAETGGANYIWGYSANDYLCLGARGTTLNKAMSSMVVESNGLYPGTTNTVSLGISSYRWSNVYSTLGNFSSRVLIGNGTDDGSTKLQVAGDISMNGTSLTDKLTELEQRLVALGG